MVFEGLILEEIIIESLDVVIYNIKVMVRKCCERINEVGRKGKKFLVKRVLVFFFFNCKIEMVINEIF